MWSQFSSSSRKADIVSLLMPARIKNHNYKQADQRLIYAMKIFVGQIYVEVGASFQFSHHFQVWLSQKLSEAITPSPRFIERYGEDFEIMFRMSAKKGRPVVEVQGPTVFKKTREIEYSVFLPYDIIAKEQDKNLMHSKALTLFLQSVVKITKSLEMDALPIEMQVHSLVQQACSNPDMIEPAE